MKKLITDWIAVPTGATVKFPSQLVYENQEAAEADIQKHGKRVSRIHEQFMIVYYEDSDELPSV